MHAHRLQLAFVFVLLALTAGCVGTTGGDTFDIQASARGSGAASRGEPSTNGLGYSFTLSRALVHVGGVYLNRSVPTSVASDTACTLPGVYVAEVPAALDVDALSPEPQLFPVGGHATAELARTGEVWLTGGDVNEPDDATAILDVAGSAEKSGQVFPFAGTLTIGQNRVPAVPPQLPGLKPICKERIVSPIAISATPERGGTLALTIDAARMFANVDFAMLAPDADGTYRFDDDPETATPASENLYIGLRAASGVYDFGFER
ncbi:MAG TPA: hypothetical protein VGQ57_20285 [Polyangiaceae bacterium]|jgi:hypothetical protein|nr:hypothetical protein [Polyangiaceae bacterium]